MMVETFLKLEIPGAPVAQGRPKFARRGAFVSTYTPQKSRDYKNHVQKMVREQLPVEYEPMTGAITVKMIFYMPVPMSWSSKKHKQALEGAFLHTSKPDLSNMVKAIEDALNKIVWEDDSQIVALTVDKLYSTVPRVEMEVRRVC